MASTALQRISRRAAAQHGMLLRPAPARCLRHYAQVGGVIDSFGCFGPTSQTLPPGIDDLVSQWALEMPTAVTLREIRDIGLDRKVRRKHGQFLHRELKIRFAQRVLELSSLPYGLPQRVGMRDVIRWYTEFVSDLEDAPEPVSGHQDEEFTNLLSRIFENHSEVIQAMAFGVQDLMREMGESYSIAQPEVDRALRRFFIARIGVRFLLQHHIESYRNRDGCSGILQLECSPLLVARKAAADSTALCRAHLGQAPQIIVTETTPGTFTYVPMHLHYMLLEVLKNACRAVVERHGHGFDDPLPPVRVQIVHGQDDLTLKISDEGGGFSRALQEDVWKFMWSTYQRSPWASLAKDSVLPRPSSGDSAANPLQRPHVQASGPSGILAGYGVGLSLSRLYAQYFGGDLRILTMDGYGTDVYLHLSRLGNHCENLPTVVRFSPSMRDSSFMDDSDGGKERFLISADEEKFLQQELLEFRRQGAEHLAGLSAEGVSTEKRASIDGPF